ncbi:MAG TPA: PilZ domain-containing protein [bacterium]|nr:PilZ domain-containing protein [bacterium]
MGIKVGRIVKEFVFKSLVDQEIDIQIHGNKKELTCHIRDVDESKLDLEVAFGDLSLFAVEETIRIFFFFQNNYHTFETEILAITETGLKIRHPEGVYKNPQRKYERIRLEDQVAIYFTLKGRKVELNFPKATKVSTLSEFEPPGDTLERANIKRLHTEFRNKMSEAVSESRITMFRNKFPERYEEKAITAMGKILWIPSTEEDFPIEDPFQDDRVITKRDLSRYEESFKRPAHVISSKLGNILFEKQKRNIFSEAWCPVIYDAYIVGYIYLCNLADKREKISTDLLDYIFQFSKVLTYALEAEGYFSTEGDQERCFEGTIIDMSASGLLFAHPNHKISEELLIQTDLDVAVQLPERKMVIGSRVRRKFSDDRYTYFGLQFLQIDPADLNYLFTNLYGKPFTSDEEMQWEGGAPPPDLELFKEG